MSKIIMSILKKTLKCLAFFSAATPSVFGTYQKDCPEKLKKFKI